MASQDSPSSQVSPVPIVAALLLAAGVLVNTPLLETARPVADERAASTQLGYQDVEARLWQDPFVVRATAFRREGVENSDRGLSRDDEAWLKGSGLAGRAARDPEHWVPRLAELVDVADPDIEIVGAMVFGGGYAEDSEIRRRARYAVVRGLQQSGYRPDNPDALGYTWLAPNVTDKADLGARLPELVPYEFFSGDAKPPQRPPRLLLLWIQEEALGEKPVRALNRLAMQVLCAPLVDALRRKSDEKIKVERPRCDERMTRQRFRIIGPSGSGTLTQIYNETLLRPGGGNEPPRAAFPIEFYSSGATVPSSRLQGLEVLEGANAAAGAGQGSWKVSLRRLAVTDEKLAGALADELVWLRGLDDPTWAFDLGQSKGCGEVVLISEADTKYAQILAEEVRTSVRENCSSKHKQREPPQVRQYTYFRGLDGYVVTPPKSGDGGSSARAGADKSEGRGAALRAAPAEQAEGRGQFDYLRRLGDELVEYDAAERRAGRPGVRAVGLLGSDVYDKLLLLQALHHLFPAATYFTTDLDARMLHPSQGKWARNLVVAAGYGFELRARLQGSAPPFRDSYQTGIYFASMVATNRVLAGAATDRSPRWFARVQLFEIGHSHAIELTRGSGAVRISQVDREDPVAAEQLKLDPKCELSVPDKCFIIFQDPEQSGTSRFIRALGARWWMFTIAIAGAILLVRATSRVFATRRREVVITAIGTIIVFAAITLLGYGNDASGRGEPLEWFEGVSLWPMVYLRALSVILTVTFLFYGWQLIRQSAMDLHRRFFGTTAAERRRSGEPPALRQRRSGLRGWIARIAWRYGRAIGMHRAFIDDPRALRDHPERKARAAATRRARVWPVDAYEWDDASLQGCMTEDGKRVNARELWRRHCAESRFIPSAVRIGITLACFLALLVLSLFFDPPNLPYRGEMVKWAANITTALSQVLLWVLVFAVVDATRRTTALIRCISNRRTQWPERVLDREQRATGLPHDDLEPWIDFRAVVKLSKSVNKFVYFPFLVILLLVVTRSTLFDSTNFPMPLLVVFLLAEAYLVYCAMTLRSAAEDARRAALGAYADRLLVLKGTVPPPGDAAVADTARAAARRAQIEDLCERIRSTRDGAFAPLLQQPFLKGLLIPFGGVGATQLLEYFALGRF